ncbi:MAG: hypothetical protein ACR65U_07450 [Methylocystis sp.]
MEETHDASFPALETDLAAAAFAHFAEKVDMLEAAIAGLAAKGEAAPDDSETLGIIAHNLNAYGAMVKAMRTLGATSPCDAGPHLMRTANPDAWAALNEASDAPRQSRYLYNQLVL